MLSELTADDRLDADGGAVDLDLDLSASRQTDAITQVAGNHQASCLIYGSSHGKNRTTALVARLNRRRLSESAQYVWRNRRLAAPDWVG